MRRLPRWSAVSPAQSPLRCTASAWISTPITAEKARWQGSPIAPANRRSTGQCPATTRSAFRANASKRAARQMAPESSWQPATDQTRSSGKFPVSSAFPVMNSSIRGRASAWRTRVSPRLTAPRSSSIRAAGRPLRPGIHRARPADRFPREGARHSAPGSGPSLSRHAAPRALLFTWLAMGRRSQQGHLPLSTAKQIKQSGMAPPLAPEMPCPSTSSPQTPWWHLVSGAARPRAGSGWRPPSRPSSEGGPLCI